MSRLAVYLSELAAVLGEEKAVHFVRLEKGSTVIVQSIENEAIPKVHARTDAIKNGNGPSDVMRAYDRLNKMLQEDNSTATLFKGESAEVIQFPGAKEEKPEFTSIKQVGEIDGEVIRVGGAGDPVPIILEIDGVQLSGCKAQRTVAKPLAAHLFEPVRLYGTGYWNRNTTGTWGLDRFIVDRFEVLNEEPLSAVVMGLRGLSGNHWGKNAINELLDMRTDKGEA